MRTHRVAPTRTAGSLLASLALLAGCTVVDSSQPSLADPPPSAGLSQGERAQAQVDCLAQNGIAASVVRVGGGFWGVRYDVPPEQVEHADQLLDECSVKVEMSDTAPTSEDEYEYMVWLVECLRFEGWEVPDPPTFDAWLEGPKNPDGGVWWPYDVVTGIDHVEFDELTSQCPQVPGTGRFDTFDPADAGQG